jgi:hypothetical protein
MPKRWLTVFAAVLGLLGAMGGAAVGGYVANRGQEHASSRVARQNYGMRIDTCVKLLRAAEREHFEPVETGDLTVRTAEAEVSLVAPTAAIREAASRFTENALNLHHREEYTSLRDEFVDLAQTELEPAE